MRDKRFEILYLQTSAPVMDFGISGHNNNKSLIHLQKYNYKMPQTRYNLDQDAISRFLPGLSDLLLFHPKKIIDTLLDYCQMVFPLPFSRRSAVDHQCIHQLGLKVGRFVILESITLFFRQPQSNFLFKKFWPPLQSFASQSCYLESLFSKV